VCFRIPLVPPKHLKIERQAAKERKRSQVVKQATHIFRFDTRGRGLVEITAEAADWLAGQGLASGLMTLFCRHTSASLTIQENASPEVLTDLDAALSRLAPEAPGLYAHDYEGLDDMPAHIRTALTGVSLSIPIIGGRMALGTWQGVFLFEHRRRPHRREIAAHVLGE
jgi:secondary thiamine-phosphate synthase enzyme